MITRISTIFFAIALVIFMSASTASAVTDFGVNGVKDNVLNSKHNLSSGGSWNTVSDTAEVCVFCHTPHQSNTADPHSAPLWNRDLTDASNYMLHAMDMSMVSGTMVMTSMMGGDGSKDKGFALVSEGSIACLSCHDGTMALDMMINAPGSGWGTGSGSAISQGYTWDEGSFMGDLDGGVMNLGTDLRNDHPISVIFGGDCTDPEADCLGNTDWGFRAATPSIYSGWNVYDADGNITPIQIYERHADEFDSNATGKVGSVECGSCHNPHLKTTTATSGTNDSLFLRMGNNTGSVTCLVCHIK